jgi:hypothetical protein
MTGAPIIEVREPGRQVRRVAVDRAIEVGRECDGEVLSDEGVSRRHLRLVPSPVALSVVDLGSRNGTLVNGVPVTGRVVLEPGAVVRLGSTEIMMIGPADETAPSPARRTMLAGQAAALVIPPPPAAPVAPRAPSPLQRFWAQVLGTAPRSGEPLFPAYTEMRKRLPLKAWHGIRIASVLAYLALCVALFIRPAGGLFAFFKVIVPLLPILFFTAPGLWRNICPLAASNQAPRVLGFTRALTPPDWLRRSGVVVSIVLFFGITSSRIALFNTSGPATGVLLSLTILNAFISGVAFKGKSGWCSRSARCCRCSASTGRRRSSRSRTATACPAWAARRTATTSGPASPTRRTCTNPTRPATPSRRSDNGSACTVRAAAPPIASRSNVPGMIWSTQVRACSPDSWRTESASVTAHQTAPRKNMTTPSSTGATIPNAVASAGMWPMTQAASRAAIALAVRGHFGGQAEELPSGLVSAFGATRYQDDRVAEPADEAAAWLDAYARRHLFHDASLFAVGQRARGVAEDGQECTPLVANSHSAEVAHSAISDTKTTPPTTGKTHLGMASRRTRQSILVTNAP